MSERFIQTLKTLADVPDEQIEKFTQIATPKDLKKNDCFIREGEIPKKFAFNRNGLFRYYYTDNKGSEYTKSFFPESTFLSSYSAMIQNRGSYYTIEALEDSSILVINLQDWQQIEEGHPCWQKFLFKLLEQGYCRKEERERELLLFDAETRYRNFLKEYPGFDKRLKQHMIASYLGITSVGLSRVRKKMGFINIG